MAPVAGHLTPAGPILPGHPVRPQDDVAAHRTGRRKQRTVNPPIARNNFLYCSSRPALRAAASGGRPRPASLMSGPTACDVSESLWVRDPMM